METLFDRSKGKLVLGDGTRFDGFLFGARHLPVWGEVVFNTAMTGYQEVITDPSYAGQLIVMTYPQIGNYGVSPSDNERSLCAARALVVRELSSFFSPGRDRMSLEDFMIERSLPGLTGVDTRALTRRIRTGGAVIGAIGSGEHSDRDLLKLAKEKTYSAGEALVKSVTKALDEAHELQRQEGAGLWSNYPAVDDVYSFSPSHRSNTLSVALIDLGAKKSIFARVEALGAKTIVFDPDFRTEEILSGGFDALVLSNGPGDPADVPEVIGKVEALLGRIPILGICLGHQITALAMGGRTYKMKFGHRGANQPVLCRRTGRVYITSQNHGYAVSDDLERAADVRITYINSNDGTVEGFSDPTHGIECVQFHPEAAPGPQDTMCLFEEFFQKVKGRRDASVA